MSQPLYLYTLEGRLVWNPNPSSPPLYLEPLESSDIVAAASYISQPTVYQTSYQSYQRVDLDLVSVRSVRVGLSRTINEPSPSYRGLSRSAEPSVASRLRT